MRYLIIILASLMLVGCVGIDSSYRIDPRYTSNIPLKNEYWNVVDKNGPKSSEEAINLLKKRSELDPIEGLWIDNSNNTKYLIILENINFSIYRVEGPYLNIRGIKDGTIFRSAGSRVYQGQEAIIVGDQIRAAGPVTYRLVNYHFLELTATFVGGKKYNYSRTYPEMKKSEVGTPSSGGSTTSKKGASGTAFFVNNKGNIVTNNHVVERCSGPVKLFYNRKEYIAKIIAKDGNLDLAALSSDVTPSEYLKLSNKPGDKLDRVVVAGYPLGHKISDELKVTSGIVSATKGWKDNINEFQIDAALNPGNSGGPVVNDAGNLFGVAVAGLADRQNLNFAIKSKAVKDFLDVNKVSYSTATVEFDMDNKKRLKLLEESTVFIFCN